MVYPKRNTYGQYKFKDFPDFLPNMSPKDIIQNGSFGGTYFRPIKYNNVHINNAWKELPKSWIHNIDISKYVVSSVYDKNINTYKVKCGSSLEDWAKNGWIRSTDPYGWFQWYCRFFLGRRTEDDERQVNRAIAIIGIRGRWRTNLIRKIYRDAKNRRISYEYALHDFTISPAIRQTLQHWAYKVTLADIHNFLPSI